MMGWVTVSKMPDLCLGTVVFTFINMERKVAIMLSLLFLINITCDPIK